MTEFRFNMFRNLMENSQQRHLGSCNYNDENQAIVSSRRWEQLPGDLLAKVMQSLNSADCIRLRAVCKPWRWIIQQNEFLSPKLPWLPLPYSSGSELEFYDLSDSVVHTVRVLKTFERACCRGSSKGWLLMANDTPLSGPDIFLFNPISGSHIRLPSMKTIPSFQLDYYLNPMWDLFDITQLIKKIEVSSSSSYSADDDDDSRCTIVAALIDSNLEGSLLAFCVLGDDEWTVFKGLIFLNEISHGDWCYDILFLDGILHVLVDPKVVLIENGTMETNTIRVGGHHDIILKLIPRYDLSSLQCHTYREEEDKLILELLTATERTYLVDCEGELLIIYKVTKLTYFPYVDDNGNEVAVEDCENVQTCQCVAVDRFEVFKMDQKSDCDNTITLTKLDNLGDNMIFVAATGSMSIPTRDLNGWKKNNCILFLDDLPCYQRYYDTTTHSISGMFSLEDKRIHRFLPRIENSMYCALCWYSPNI